MVISNDSWTVCVMMIVFCVWLVTCADEVFVSGSSGVFKYLSLTHLLFSNMYLMAQNNLIKIASFAHIKSHLTLPLH